MRRPERAPLRVRRTAGTRALAPLVLAAGLASAAAGVPASVQPVPVDVDIRARDEAEVRAAHAAVVAARARPDAAAFHALAGDDLFVIEADGRWHARDAALEHAWAGGAPRAVEARDVVVRLFGGVALVHAVLDAGPAARWRQTAVYQREDGGLWRLVGLQETSLKSPAGTAMHEGVAPAAVPWSGRDPAGDDDSVLRALNAAYVDAFRRADVAWYEAHLAPGYVVVSGDGSLHDRGAALADFAEPVFERSIRKFPVDKVRVRRFGDVALVHAENDYELKDGRRGVNRYTDVWVRRDGTWTCVAAHITVHRPPG